MNAQDFEDLLSLGKQFRGHENQPERDPLGAELPAQLLRPPLQTLLVKFTRPMRCDRMIIPHASNLAGAPPFSMAMAEAPLSVR